MFNLLMNKKTFPVKQKGFSLLEILVAFSILALSLGILLNIFSSGVQTAVLSEDYISAVQVAESLLAKAGVEDELVEGQLYGTQYDKYSWSVTTSLYDVYNRHNLESSDSDFKKKDQEATVYQVVATVSWGDEDDKNVRSVELNTLKYGTNES